MDIKKLTAAVLSLALCGCFVSCGSSDSSSSDTTDSAAGESSVAVVDSEDTSDAQAESETDSESTEEVGTTDYDVNGDFRAFDDIKSTYGDGYSIAYTTETLGNQITGEITISDGKAYTSTVVSGMKSYSVLPGDGNLYSVYEATTTYSVTEANDSFAAQADFLFGSTGDFSKAEIDTATNIVYEYYTLSADVAGYEGEIAYGFDGATYELKAIQIIYDGVDTPVEYEITSLDKADETLLEVPDLSGYTQE